MSRALKSKRKEAISTLVSVKDLLAELPTGFGKSSIFFRLPNIVRSKYQPIFMTT